MWGDHKMYRVEFEWKMVALLFFFFFFKNLDIKRPWTADTKD